MFPAGQITGSYESSPYWFSSAIWDHNVYKLSITFAAYVNCFQPFLHQLSSGFLHFSLVCQFLLVLTFTGISYWHFGAPFPPLITPRFLKSRGRTTVQRGQRVYYHTGRTSQHWPPIILLSVRHVSKHSGARNQLNKDQTSVFFCNTVRIWTYLLIVG